MAQSLQIKFSEVENPFGLSPLIGTVLMVLQKVQNIFLCGKLVGIQESLVLLGLGQLGG